MMEFIHTYIVQWLVYFSCCKQNKSEFPDTTFHCSNQIQLDLSMQLELDIKYRKNSAFSISSLEKLKE